MDKPQQPASRRAPAAKKKAATRAVVVKPRVTTKPAVKRAPVAKPKKRKDVLVATAPEQEPEPGCRHCEGQPAADVEFRAVRGVLRSYHREDLPGPWCLECGEATYRSAMNRTFLGAWWGNRSFVGGIAAVRANRKARRVTAALSAPERTADSPAPKDPGRPLWRRSGAVVAAAMTFVLVLAGIGIAVTAGETPADQFADTCIRVDETGGRVGTVSCGEQNDGKVLDIVANESECPKATDGVVTLEEDADKIICVEDTR